MGNKKPRKRREHYPTFPERQFKPPPGFEGHPAWTIGYQIVYVARAWTGLTKIGITYRLQARLTTLRWEAAGPCQLLHLIDSNIIRQAERYMHRQYRHKRRRGEWFLLDEGDLAAIREIQRIEWDDQTGRMTVHREPLAPLPPDAPQGVPPMLTLTASLAVARAWADAIAKQAPTADPLDTDLDWARSELVLFVARVWSRFHNRAGRMLMTNDATRLATDILAACAACREVVGNNAVLATVEKEAQGVVDLIARSADFVPPPETPEGLVRTNRSIAEEKSGEGPDVDALITELRGGPILPGEREDGQALDS